jgi:hypothetical protein
MPALQKSGEFSESRQAAWLRLLEIHQYSARPGAARRLLRARMFGKGAKGATPFLVRFLPSADFSRRLTTEAFMRAPKASQTSFAVIIVSVVTALAAAGCDYLEDVTQDILKARDGGVVPDVLPSNCTSDADCRVFSDYCTGCDCRTLGINESDPVCSGAGVQCLVDPCLNKAATCQAGRCALTAPPPPASCRSSAECDATKFCTTETGACSSPPGCGAPNTACPAICYGTCQPRASKGPTCGTKICATGMVCCNASCGICTLPNGACTQQFCL